MQHKGVYNEDQVSWIKLKFHGIHWLPIFVNSSSYRCMKAAKRGGADSGRLWKILLKFENRRFSSFGGNSRNVLP